MYFDLFSKILTIGTTGCNDRTIIWFLYCMFCHFWTFCSKLVAIGTTSCVDCTVM